MRNGQLIVEQVHTKVDELLSMIDDDDEGCWMSWPAIRGNSSSRRWTRRRPAGCSSLCAAASRKCGYWPCVALGRTGDLDYVPSLLYALTDPDRRVVLEARNGLRFISRNFEGFGPPDDFTEQQRYEAADAWKKWYQSLRPMPSWKKNTSWSESFRGYRIEEYSDSRVRTPAS